MLPTAYRLFSQLTPINSPDCPVDAPSSTQCNTNLPMVGADKATIQPVLTIFFGILGLVAVIIIIVAGLQFITGQGDPQKIKNARNTIIWALLGLGIAVMAEAAVYVLVNAL